MKCLYVHLHTYMCITQSVGFGLFLQLCCKSEITLLAQKSTPQLIIGLLTVVALQLFLRPRYRNPSHYPTPRQISPQLRPSGNGLGPEGP